MRRLAWCGWWTVLLGAALRALTLWDQWRRTATRSGAELVSDYAFVLVIVVFPLVGLVILARQPRNRVAWLLEGVGLVWCISWLLDAYAWYGLAIDPGSLPGAGVAAAVNEGMWTWGILVMGFYLVLLFPDGRLPTPRWRWLAWLAPSAAFAIHVVVAVSPGELAEGPVDGFFRTVDDLRSTAVQVPKRLADVAQHPCHLFDAGNVVTSAHFGEALMQKLAPLHAAREAALAAPAATP